MITATFKSQLDKLGLSYDWDREITTSEPRYYKWTQWIFEQLFARGLSVPRRGVGQLCPRSAPCSPTRRSTTASTSRPATRSKRKLWQWMLAITKYAERLVDDLEGLQWPNGVQGAARPGSASRSAPTSRSQSANAARPSRCSRRVRTRCSAATTSCSRPSTRSSTRSPRPCARRSRRTAPGKRSDRDRTTEAADAEDRHVHRRVPVNPVDNKRIPIWIAIRARELRHRAVFACPAHDERDHAFAVQFQLPIVNSCTLTGTSRTRRTPATART